MRKTLAAAVMAVTMACGPEVPADDGLDATGRMAWRGSAYATLHLDAPGAPADVVGALRRGVLRQVVQPTRFSTVNYLVPEVLYVHTGYCGLTVDTRTDRVTQQSGNGCAMASPVDGPDGGSAFLSVWGTLTAATATRTATEIRIATTWTAHSDGTSDRPQPWDGPVSVTYVLTR